MRFWKAIVKGVGLFCGNFCTGRGPYPPCQMMWCVCCYTDELDNIFPYGERGVEGYWESEVERRYEAVSNVDQLLTHFQCDNFHFCNIKGRSSEESNLKDKTLLETIRGLSLDAFWIRDPRTIKLKNVDVKEYDRGGNWRLDFGGVYASTVSLSVDR